LDILSRDNGQMAKILESRNVFHRDANLVEVTAIKGDVLVGVAKQPLEFGELTSLELLAAEPLVPRQPRQAEHTVHLLPISRALDLTKIPTRISGVALWCSGILARSHPETPLGTAKFPIWKRAIFLQGQGKQGFPRRRT
jgi:hypothetical protein